MSLKRFIPNGKPSFDGNAIFAYVFVFLIIFAFTGTLSCVYADRNYRAIDVFIVIKNCFFALSIYITFFSILFLTSNTYSKPVYFWIDFIPYVNVLGMLYKFIIVTLYGIEKLIIKVILSYVQLASYSTNEKMKESIRITEKMTEHIRKLRKDSGCEADDLTKQLLRKGRIMLEEAEGFERDTHKRQCNS